MAKRYIGDAVVSITYYDATYGKQDGYRGTVSAGGYRWRFDELHAPAVGHGAGIAYDSPEAYDSMAQSAVAFGSNYDPEYGSPSREVASEIDQATSWALREDGSYEVRRSPGGPPHALQDNPWRKYTV